MTKPQRARNSDPTLLMVEQLRDTMHEQASAEERSAWWNVVLRLQSAIDADKHAGKAEAEAMRRLRAGVTDVYGALNRGYAPDYSGAIRAIMSLQYVLEARTTGFDGYRLR